MSPYSQQYYGYYPSQYQPVFWQAAFPVLIDIMILVSVGAWSLSLVKKAIRGEEVELR